MKYSLIPTHEAVRRTGISATNLNRHAYDERLTPVLIDGDQYWSISELKQLVQRIADEGVENG